MVQLKEKEDLACFLVLKWKKKKKSSHNVQKNGAWCLKVNVLVGNIDTLVQCVTIFLEKSDCMRGETVI